MIHLREDTNILDTTKDKYTVVTIDPENLEEFKHAMVRAMQTWQDASPEMKKFYDELNGNSHWPMAKR